MQKKTINWQSFTPHHYLAQKKKRDPIPHGSPPGLPRRRRGGPTARGRLHHMHRVAILHLADRLGVTGGHEPPNETTRVSVWFSFFPCFSLRVSVCGVHSFFPYVESNSFGSFSPCTDLGLHFGWLTGSHVWAIRSRPGLVWLQSISIL